MGTVLERDNTEYPSWFKCVEILKYKYKNEKKKVQSNIKEKFLCAEKEKKMWVSGKIRISTSWSHESLGNTEVWALGRSLRPVFYHHRPK